MATTASIAARRQRALERIAKAIGFTPKSVRAAPEFRHAAELEQIADHLDPDNRVAPASPAAARLTASDGPPPSHEEAIAASMPPGVAAESETPLPETSDERKEPPAAGRDREPVQGERRPAPAARGDRQQHPRPR